MGTPTDVSPLSSPFTYSAQSAVDYVKSVLYVAGNKVGDILMTTGAAAACVVAKRLLNPDDKSQPHWDRIHRWAADAEASHCGNCGEYAAVAFVYLENQPKIRPLEFMYFQAPGDHNYVVIGRAAGSIITDPGTWGRQAMVCDPWKGSAYPASDLSRVWPGCVPGVFFRLG